MVCGPKIAHAPLGEPRTLDLSTISGNQFVNLNRQAVSAPAGEVTYSGLNDRFEAGVSVFAPQPYSIQWRRNTIPVADSTRIHGSTILRLLIDPVRPGDGGDYDALVTTACGTASSGSVHLHAPACGADFNGDGTANSEDFFDFLAAFFALDPAADFNHSGTVDSQDFFDFPTAFFAGCP
jgi:hypothetical protein